MSHPALEEFQIGWICALPIEMAAAREMLDENWGILQEQSIADSTSYTLGRIGVHYVAVACLPQYGTASAAIVANDMMRTFSSSLRIGLMVGIGGGIPSTEHDIRLGDVVISYPGGTCGGVVQHDMGKLKEFRQTGNVNGPPRELLIAVNSMRAAVSIDTPSYPEYMEKAINRTSRTRKNFGRPNPQSDRLFKVEYEHPSSVATCDGCPSDWEEKRLHRQHRNPILHYGIIASGDTVIKDGSVREQLRQETGALCCEMEGAGLIHGFPFIVIRGICDYADSHKNKKWQGYAAVAAAAYAKELLGYVHLSSMHRKKPVKDMWRTASLFETNHGELKKYFGLQGDYYRKDTLIVLSEQQQRCHQRFKTSAYEQCKNINPDRVERTCQWALKNERYIRWLGSKCNDFLWISADPGCGKSVLAKSLIDNEFKAPGVSVCYFFFKDNDEQRSLSTALCAILHQLFDQQPCLLRHALPYWKKNGSKIRQEVDQLWSVLLAAASDPAAPGTIICVLDALDECHEVDQDRLIRKLNQFYHNTGSSPQESRLKVLITSRPYSRITEGFHLMTNAFPHLRLRGEMGNDQIRKDIKLVVKLQMKQLATTLSLPHDVAWNTEEQLLKTEHRTYLWLHLAMDDIRTAFRNSLRPDKVSIQQIPPSVDAAYRQILSKVPPGHEHTARTILQIIVSARRPLTLEEMAIALGMATSPESRTTKHAGLDLQGLDEKLRHLCGLFIYISERRVYLIHETAREFLMAQQPEAGSPYQFNLRDAEDQMAEICVRYLLMEDLESDPAQQESDNQSFPKYAAENWAYHVRKASISDSILLYLLNKLYDTTTWIPALVPSILACHTMVMMVLSQQDMLAILTNPIMPAQLH
ncbi:Pfs, NACHT and ankyrin domain protein [Paecilomyces variotii No. 5]|uniref:Pfs, NACHT and ankyrin domain protein, partial n=1 Tax=Byssochlamys spectabilis (strain No. 5 / NBRC 109023) TaxID=1356009 RepID=V5G7R5_BYSSN|nr:Pfs, NACHT and ankyrin domain protein [Paecilomyces variotii No. 5]